MKSKAAIGRLTVLGSLLSLGIVFFCLATDMNTRDPSPQTSLPIKPQNPLADDDLALTHWITSDGYQPMPFAEWQAQQPPPSPLHIEQIYASAILAAGDPADRVVCAIVNPAIYNGIAAALALWAADLENEGWQVTIFNASFPDQQALRSHLANIDNLDGCVLVGDFPVPWYELDSKQFPFDVYYMDLNGTWIDSDLDGLYDDHTGDVAPEIWIGRLLANNLDFSGDEVSLLNNYFAKNHAYRTRLLALPSRALVYLDDDWEYAAQNMGQQTAILYSDTTVVSDPNTTRAGDYARRLTDYYAWVHVFAHSTTSGHNFTINDGTTRDAIYNDDIRQIDPHTFFYNLFACGAARFVERNYLSGWYVFADTYGLLTIGSTTTGGMVRGYGLFFGFLAAGLPLGQAFRDWFAVEGVIDRGWHYGLTLHGDPTLVVNTEEQVSEPPTSVTITGPTTGDVRSPNIFTATVDPITATQPFEYVWTATDQLTVTHKSGLSDTIALNWRNTHGVKFITLTVTNFAGTVTGSHIITVAAPEMEIAPHSFHKTLVQGEWLTRSLTISNTGQGSLAFELFEADPGSSPGHDPDPFGYAYKDSAMAGGPIYQWIEIAPPAGGSGTQANLPTTWEGGYTWPIPLPFAFEFYGGVYTDVAINSHGTLSFRDRHIGRINVPIPSVRSFGDEILIAHFWDFLVIDPGAVYYQALDSMFIVEYYQVSRYGGSDHGTWEIILFDTGNILFQYQDVDFAYYWGNNGQSATVGIQGDAITGLQYSYDTPKLSNGLAICFAHPG